MLSKLTKKISGFGTWFLFLVTFVIVLLCLVLLYNFFRVTEIAVYGTRELQNTSMYHKSFLPVLNVDEIEKTIYRSNPDIVDVDVTKAYPRSLILKVERGEPQVIITIADGYIVLNTGNRIVSKVKGEYNREEEDLTEISYYQQFYYEEYAIGDTVERADIKTAVTFLGKMIERGEDIDSIDITSPHMIVLVGTDKRYIVTIEKDIEVQFEQLRLIDDKLRSNGEEYSQIDLRFEKPIITF